MSGPAHPRIGVLVGNPKPRSRTFAAAVHVATELGGGVAPDLVVDLADLGPGLLGADEPRVQQALDAVRDVDVLVVASPTYKATYTGLLKLFLDRLPPQALDGVRAVPLMLGAGPAHALAPELLLKPVLVEVGASTPTRALYLSDSAWEDAPATAAWLPAARRQLGLAVPVGAVPTGSVPAGSVAQGSAP